MPCPLLNKGARISNPPISPGVAGVLRPPATSFHACLSIAYRGLCSPLRAVPGYQSSFRTVEGAVLLVPHSKKVSMYQVGGAEVWRIAGTGYLSRTTKKASEDWPSEWFYIEDVPLPDPVRIGLPEFDSAPLKKRLSWHPRSPQRESDRDIIPDVPNKIVSPFRTNHDRGYGRMHHAGGATASV